MFVYNDLLGNTNVGYCIFAKFYPLVQYLWVPNTLHDQVSALWKIRMAAWVKHRNSNNAVTGLWNEYWLIAWVTVKRIVFSVLHYSQCNWGCCNSDTCTAIRMPADCRSDRRSDRRSANIQARNGTRLGVVGMRRLPVVTYSYAFMGHVKLVCIDLAQVRLVCPGGAGGFPYFSEE
jgi:hypothetical protein